MMRKLADKDESKKEKDNNVDNKTKEVEINENGEVAETDNDKLVVDAANDAPPPQDIMTTTTALAAEEVGDDNNVVAEERHLQHPQQVCHCPSLRPLRYR